MAPGPRWLDRASLDGRSQAFGRAWRPGGRAARRRGLGTGGRPQGVAQRREYRTAGRSGPPLTLAGRPAIRRPVSRSTGHGRGRVPCQEARRAVLRPIRAPARTRATGQPGQAGRRVGTLAGSVQEEKAGWSASRPSHPWWRWWRCRSRSPCSAGSYTGCFAPAAAAELPDAQPPRTRPRWPTRARNRGTIGGRRQRERPGADRGRRSGPSWAPLGGPFG